MYKKFVKNLSKKDEVNFYKEYKVLAVNRHLKVIGIFSRLYMRDKKESYLKGVFIADITSPEYPKIITSKEGDIYSNQKIQKIQ